MPSTAAIRRVGSQQLWTAGAVALLLGIAFSAIYLATRTTYYSVDAIEIATNIVAFHKTHNFVALFRPGYLAYEPIGLTAWKAAQSFGYRGGPLQVLEAINSIAGGIGIAFLSLLLRAILTRSRAMTLLIPIAVGFSFGYWATATDARSEMPAIACLLAAIFLLIRAMLLPSIGRVAAAGLVTSIACLLHLFCALLIPVGLIAICLAEYTQGIAREERRAQLINSAIYLACAILPVVVAYAFVGEVVLRLHGALAWRQWLHQGFNADWTWSPHFFANLRLDGYAFRRALFVEPGAKTGTFHLEQAGGMMHVLLYWAALGAWFIAVYAILSATAFLMRTHYRVYLIVALAFSLVYALAFTYVSPGNFVYWVPVVIGSAIMTAICGSYYRGRRGGPGWLVGIGVWIAIFAASNYAQFIGMHRSIETNPAMQEAWEIKARTQPGDIIVVSGFGDDASIVAYVPYFTHRTVFSLRDSLSTHAGNIVLTKRDLRGAVVQALSNGHRAYAYGGIWSDPSVRDRLKSDYGASSPQELFDRLQRAPAWRDTSSSQEIVWKLIPVDETSAANRAPGA